MVIDRAGYRLNVGIVLINETGLAFWGKRFGHEAWQFPQGGVSPNETAQDTMFRELHEEIGLTADDVEIRNPEAILKFKSQYPDVDAYLVRAKEVINKYFPKTTLALEIIDDPDALGETRSLYVVIKTNAEVADAMKLLDLVDQELFTNSKLDLRLFNITLEFN